MTEAFAGAFHLGIPVASILYYLHILAKMRRLQIEDAPVMDLFIVFFTYGGLLLVVMTVLFWYWSAMASLGAVYLILVAPVLLGIIAVNQNSQKEKSVFHRYTRLAAIRYFIIAPAVLLLLALANEIREM